MRLDPFTVEIDGVRIGVRVDDRGVRERLLDQLKPHVLDVPTTVVNYALGVADDERQFNILRWGGCVAVRSRDVARLWRGLDRHLGGHGRVPDGLVRLDAVAAVGPAGAILLPRFARQQVASMQRPLAGAGVELTDEPWALIDPVAAELVVRQPGLLDEGAGGVPAGRFPLRAVVQHQRPDELPSAAEQASALWSDVRDPVAVPAALAAAVLALVDRVDVVAVDRGQLRLTLRPYERLVS